MPHGNQVAVAAVGPADDLAARVVTHDSTAVSDWRWSFSQSFHLALLGPTGAHWLDDEPDMSCQDSTGQHAVNAEVVVVTHLVGGADLAVVVLERANRRLTASGRVQRFAM
jgi:hypothetical protein